MKKPISFKIAAILYITGMAFGLIRDLLYTFAFELKPDFYYINPYAFPIIVVSVFVGFLLIMKGLNWVRYASLALYLVSLIKLVLYPENLSSDLDAATILGILILLSYLFRGVSIYFLFNQESMQFFKLKKITEG